MDIKSRKQGDLPIVLMAEDDSDDRFLMDDVFKTNQHQGELRFVVDGEELMEYLLRRGKFADPELAPRPSLILLDLNMPKKDGREALSEIKADPGLTDIPIIVWTTSNLREDRVLCLERGAKAFFTKPNNYEDLKKIVAHLCTEWLKD